MPDFVLYITLALSALCLYGAFVFSLRPVRKRFAPSEKTARILHLSGTALNVLLILYNYVINLVKSGVNYVPFVSMYQITVFIAFCFFPAWLFLEKGCGRKGLRLFFALGAALALTACFFMPLDAEFAFKPANRSPYFIPHILCYVFAYALSFAAAIIVLYGLIRKKDLSGSASLCARVLFPLLTCGLFMGAIWADQIWGDFWSWDLKESWSLVTWLVYMLALHLYRRAKLKKIADLLMILGFVCVLMTFLFTRIFPNVSTVHGYSYTAALS